MEADAVVDEDIAVNLIVLMWWDCWPSGTRSSTAVLNVLTLVNMLQLSTGSTPLRMSLPLSLMRSHQGGRWLQQLSWHISLFHYCADVIQHKPLKNPSHSMDTTEPTLTAHLTELDASSHVGSVHFCKPDMLKMYIHLWCSFWLDTNVSSHISSVVATNTAWMFLCCTFLTLYFLAPLWQ